MQIDRTQPQTSARTKTFDPGLQAFFRRIYGMMTGGLVITTVVALVVSSSPVLLQALYGNFIISMIVMMAPLAFSLVFNSNRIMQMAPEKSAGLFYLFSGVLGLSMGYIFMAYTHESITRVFLIAAIMFAGMSIFGYTTRRDLSGMGSMMIMGAWGVFIAFMVNIFLHSSMLLFVASVIGVIAYTGLVAYNTQSLKQMYNANNGYTANSKLATIGALRLYIDFINLFMMLLQLMGSRR